MQWIAPSEKDSANNDTGKAPLGGCRPVPRQFRPKGARILRPDPRPHLPALCRGPLRQHRAEAGKASASIPPRQSRLMNPPPTTPKASSTSRRRRASTTCSICPKAQTSARRSTRRCATIEKHNPQLAGVLPKTYNLFTSTLLKELLKKVSEIPASARLRRLRPHLRILPRRVRPHRGPEGRRVLHAGSIVRLLAEDHRALPRPHPRPRLRLGRHVRAVGALRRRAPEEPGAPSSPSTASRRPTRPAASAA